MIRMITKIVRSRRSVEWFFDLQFRYSSVFGSVAWILSIEVTWLCSATPLPFLAQALPRDTIVLFLSSFYGLWFHFYPFSPSPSSFFVLQLFPWSLTAGHLFCHVAVFLRVCDVDRWPLVP